MPAHASAADGRDKARTDIDARAAGRPKAQGERQDMVVGKRGIFARGRGPGPKWGSRHR